MKTKLAYLFAVPLAIAAFAAPAVAADKDQMKADQDPVAFETIRAGDLETAEKALMAAKENEDPFQLLNLAYVMQKTGRSDEAAALYRQILDSEQNPYAKLASGDPRRVKSIARDGLAYLDQKVE